MKNVSISIVLVLIALTTLAQGKKERKVNKIKAITEWETAVVAGKTVPFKSIYEEFDREGRSTLRIEYDSAGNILLRSTVKYDSYGNKIAETDYNAAKKRNVILTSRYNAFKDKTEESEFNEAGVLQKKTVFTYDNDGKRLTETETNPAGEVIKKTVYTYNAKDLKTEKSVTKGKQPGKSKRWEYVYY
jgi:uncharacterized protein YbbC (DUF1343 family)